MGKFVREVRVSVRLVRGEWIFNRCSGETQYNRKTFKRDFCSTNLYDTYILFCLEKVYITKEYIGVR